MIIEEYPREYLETFKDPELVEFYIKTDNPIALEILIGRNPEYATIFTEAADD